MDDNRIKKGLPYPMGATVSNNGINFATVDHNDVSGIILYPKDKEQEQVRIPFDKKYKVGNISCLMIKDIDPEAYDYNFYHDDEIRVDPYAKRIFGNEIWGEYDETRELRGGFAKKGFDWQKTKPLHISYADSIIYCIHVRGFTQHASSKVKHKGTFLGIQEKIPYLKELGITALELMPAYEFAECQKAKTNQSMEYAVAHLGDDIEQEQEIKLNYWGYQKAYYFAPKASYTYGSDPTLEFKELVRTLHQNGIEVIMQFYFPDSCKQGYILEVLKHWVLEYMIDGFHLKGNRIPITLLATEPMFANTKIMYHDFPLEEIYVGDEKPIYKNLAYYRDDFMQDMRKFLKSDMDMLPSVQFHMQNHPKKAACINFISNYYGFSLTDLVSYDRKHNEANGEENRDGTDYNYSWNCGIEGETRKKTILALRKKQIRNALAFVFLAQGTPLLMSGDEFGNTQFGNNNPYCQDNEISWVIWKNTAANKALLSYTKALIALRKAHPILHREEMMMQMDTLGCGYPDLSYHGEEAWRIHLENYNRHLAFMYCGKYCKIDHRKQDDFFYIAFNMYWEEKSFALPRLPEGVEWEIVLDTSSQDGIFDEQLPRKSVTKELTVPGRTVCCLKSRKKSKIDKKGKV